MNKIVSIANNINYCNEKDITGKTISSQYICLEGQQFGYQTKWIIMKQIKWEK
jgi:hypothetical protein